jgi:BlaI family penicillinase repressor
MAKRKDEFREHELSRRERQIMAAVYRLGQATVAEIVASIPDPPTPDAIRRLCHILEEKGHLRARADGPRKVYLPTVEPHRARRKALENLIDTFFGGSPQLLAATLLDTRERELGPEDVQRLSALIDRAEEDAGP